MLPAVPSVFEMLCRAGGGPAAFPRLRAAYSAGALLPPAVAEAFARRYGVRVGQVYGATEIGSVTTTKPADDDFDPTRVGRPMEGVEVRILDPDRLDPAHPLPTGAEGVVAVRAPSMLSHYVSSPRKTGYRPKQSWCGGFFITGDLGRLDAGGSLTPTGRAKLIIDVGGRKVNPAEVEAVLAEHPAVGACVVVGVAVSETVFRLKAVVTATEGSPPVDRRGRGRLTAVRPPAAGATRCRWRI